jgi:hypothetical protein
MEKLTAGSALRIALPQGYFGNADKTMFRIKKIVFLYF